MRRKVHRGDWPTMLGWAQGEVETTLAQLPDPLRETARQLQVVYERAPASHWIKEGIEPDTLGLFVGPAFGEELFSSDPMPARIFLFLENLWEMSGGEEPVFREETRTTFLHELGHYLGLDEEDLSERGLE